jgi:vancomycin permeability regulator SanA
MRKLLRWLTISVLSLIALWLIAALILIINGLKERVEPADVAVVLGNEVYLNGEPSPQLEARLDRAVELFRQRLFPQIVVSGGI